MKKDSSNEQEEIVETLDPRDQRELNELTKLAIRIHYIEGRIDDLIRDQGSYEEIELLRKQSKAMQEYHRYFEQRVKKFPISRR